MLAFDAFATAAPSVAEPIRVRLEATNLGFIGTVRKDGSPRVSPFEIRIAHGRLLVGAMPGSVKARDLQRDPRCCVVTALMDANDRSPEGKLFAVAVEITDPAEAATALGAFSNEELDPANLASSHAFEMLVTGAALQYVERDTWVTLSWDHAGGIRHRRRAGPTGSTVDVES